MPVLVELDVPANPVDISLFRAPAVVPHTQDFDHPVVQSGRRAIRKEAERGRPDINCLCHEDASTIPSGEHPCRRDSGPVRCELSMLRSLVPSELASEADLGKFLRPTQMAHRRRSIPNIGAASAVSRVGPTHRSIEHAIGRVGRSDRSAQGFVQPNGHHYLRTVVYLNGYRVAAMLRPNTWECELTPEAV